MQHENKGRPLPTVAGRRLVPDDPYYSDDPAFWWFTVRGIDDVLTCPEAEEGQPILISGLTVDGPHIGTADSHWWNQVTNPVIIVHQTRGSGYGMNGWVLAPGNIVNGGKSFGFFRDEPSISLFVRPQQSGEPIPWFADCVVSWGFPRPKDQPPDNLHAPRDVTQFWDRVPSGDGSGSEFHEHDMRNFCIARHGRAINMVFNDGSARRVGLDDLWQLKWSNEFGYTRPRPVLPVR